MAFGFPEFLTGGDLVLLVLIGLGAGVLSGFAGVGGGFLVTPALIIIGFPAVPAVGTSLAWVAGNSVVATLRHRRMGNIDFRMGLVMTVASMVGMEGGIRLLNWFKAQGLADPAVLSVAVVLLVLVGAYTLIESQHRKKEIEAFVKQNRVFTEADDHAVLARKVQALRLPPVWRFQKSGVSISVWIIGGIGLVIGLLAGIMGVGGGFVVTPALIYVVGMPSFLAVGTSLFQVVFAASYGAARQGLSGNVALLPAVIMLVASSVGVQFGALVTSYVRGLSVRYVLGVAIILSAVGVTVKLVSTIVGGAALLDSLSVVITFGGLLVTVGMIVALFVLSLRYRRGREVPCWVVSLLAAEPGDVGKPNPH